MSNKSSEMIPEPLIAKILFSDTRLSIVWFFLRIYVGYQWLMAGWGKVNNPAWVGSEAGKALSGFVAGALEKTGGAHPDVAGWYGDFLNTIVLPNASIFSYMVAFGELLVGIALILGAFTGIAAFFGAFMNMNFLFAGTVSINPLLFLIELFLILSWRSAGWLGFDRYLLPMLGTPWSKGKIFKKSR